MRREGCYVAPRSLPTRSTETLDPRAPPVNRTIRRSDAPPPLPIRSPLRRGRVVGLRFGQDQAKPPKVRHLLKAPGNAFNGIIDLRMKAQRWA